MQALSGGRDSLQVPREPKGSKIIGEKEANPFIDMGGRFQFCCKNIWIHCHGYLKLAESQHFGLVILLPSPASPPTPLAPVTLLLGLANWSRSEAV